MQQTQEHIDRLASKFQVLLKQYEKLQKENGQLRKQAATMEADFSKMAEISEQLAQQNLLLKASVGNMNEKEKKALASRLNGYIKNIDNCISLLST